MDAETLAETRSSLACRKVANLCTFSGKFTGNQHFQSRSSMIFSCARFGGNKAKLAKNQIGGCPVSKWPRHWEKGNTDGIIFEKGDHFGGSEHTVGSWGTPRHTEAPIRSCNFNAPHHAMLAMDYATECSMPHFAETDFIASNYTMRDRSKY